MEALLILKQQLNAFYPLPEDVLDAVVAPWEEIVVKRKTMLTKAGSTEQYLYLVLEGVQHAVCESGNKEATLVFSYPYSFSGILDSFLTQQSATCRLETITHSRLLRIHYQQLMKLVQAYPVLDQWLWKSLALVLKGTLERQAELLLAGAEEKFTALLRRSPQVLNLIPHKYLASYIGVDASTFSKMLGSVRV